MKRVKYLLVTMLMVCLALAGCGSQSANLVPGEYMGMTFGVPESWESEEGNHSLDYKSTYGGDSPVEFSLIISLRNIAEDTALVGETDWNADVANKVIENRINGTYQYFDTYEALSTEEMVIDGHPALLHYFTLTAPDGEGKSNFESYVAGTEGQYVSILVKYEDAAQDITDTIKKDVDAFIKSIDLSDLDADAISAVWSPKSTPEPTIEPVEWVDMEWKGVKLRVPGHWKPKMSEQLEFDMDYIEPAAAIIQIIPLGDGSTWDEETADIVKEATIQTYSESAGYQFLLVSDMAIADEPGFVFDFYSETSNGTVLYNSLYAVGKENYYVCVNFAQKEDASLEMNNTFGVDKINVLGSLDVSGMPVYMETEEVLAPPLTLLKVNEEGRETEYTATAPEGFSDDEYSEIPSHISMHDFLEKYPILGVTVQIEPAKIHFLSLREESRYTFVFEEASLRTKSKGHMAKDKIKEIAASAPSADSEETKWVEQEYEGISFLLPDCLAESESGGSGRNVFAGRLSGGAVASVFLVVTDMSGNGLDWENEIDRYLIQEKMLETASKKEGYQAVATEEMQFGSYPGYMHRYTEMDYDDKYESTMYCFLVDDLFVIFASTIDDNAGTDKEELNEIMSRVISSVNVSGLE